jgi:hypothetical protein
MIHVSCSLIDGMNVCIGAMGNAVDAADGIAVEPMSGETDW